MKRVFSHPGVAIAVGLCLRLLFVLRFPANSGDTVLYDQIATNWLKHHVYAMNVNGAIAPVDLRMPGYPAFLAILYALTGRSGADARIWIMLTQTLVDLLSCLLIAGIAALIASFLRNQTAGQRTFMVALWLAVLCPFTANYVAVSLTEVFATFFTAISLFLFCLFFLRLEGFHFQWPGTSLHLDASPEMVAGAAGFTVGVGTLFRPETPLLLVSALLVIGIFLLRQKKIKTFLRVAIISGITCVLPLAPWAIRNAITLHEVQLLAPKNSNLPGELVPIGFMAWEKTWLYRLSDVYAVSWKLNDEPIEVEQIPARAFDSEDEKQRVAAILEPYNDEVTFTAEEDAAFAQLARERKARHPIRTHLLYPLARVFTIWFTPRIELIPVSGHVFPLAQTWEDDPIDQSVTIGFFLLNIFYVALGFWGVVRVWKQNPTARTVLILLITFVVLRTAFLTTLETPEPRYVLVCFPIVIALAAQVFLPKTMRTAN